MSHKDLRFKAGFSDRLVSGFFVWKIGYCIFSSIWVANTFKGVCNFEMFVRMRSSHRAGSQWASFFLHTLQIYSFILFICITTLSFHSQFHVFLTCNPDLIHSECRFSLISVISSGI